MKGRRFVIKIEIDQAEQRKTVGRGNNLHLFEIDSLRFRFSSFQRDRTSRHQTREYLIPK